jgi:protein transport protein SEC61 subunit gamma-like protein
MGKFTSHLSSKFQQYLRVWRLLKKPTYTEFKTISKVSAIGLLVIGAIGFIISVGIKLFSGL